MASSTQTARIQAGQCPHCGTEAAPYYLCGDCRQLAFIRRVLKKAERHDIVQQRPAPNDRRFKQWQWTGKSSEAFVYQEARPGDKRLEPRLNKVPVDIMQEVVKILAAEARPITEEEIIQAWGRLRVRAGRLSAANDLAYLIRAERKKRAKWQRQRAQQKD